MRTHFLTGMMLGMFGLATGFATTPQSDDVRAKAAQIDALLRASWQKHQVQGNPLASDETFVRRIHLDLVGRIPTTQETLAFLNSTDPDKRARLIDSLLQGEGYTLHLYHFWADLLRVLSKGTYPGAAGRVTGMAYAEYIKDAVRANKPYDVFVRELVTAQGSAWRNGAVGYYQRDRGMPLDNMALTTRIFLGTRIECAQCHNDPFDKWTQMQFHQMAVYTYGVQTTFGVYIPSFDGMLALHRERRMKDHSTSSDSEVHLRQAFNEMIGPIKHAYVSHRPATLRLPHDYAYTDAVPKSVVKPATLMGHAAEYSPTGDPLGSFAAWLASPENPRFTKTIANRLWKKLFGLGLIEPVDEMRDDTVAANPALMAYLEKLMIAQRYDVKAFLRILCNTNAYQRDVTRQELAAGEPYHFTGPVLRRMTAEQMWDSLVTLMNPAPDMPSLDLRESTDTFLANARKLGEGLASLPPGELLERADLTSEIFRKNATTVKDLQRQMAEAREDQDKARVTALSRQIGVLRKTEIQTANDNIYVPAVLKLSAGDTTPTSSTNNYEDLHINGFEPPNRMQERNAQRDAFLKEAERIRMPAAVLEKYVAHRFYILRQWPRAAELESPAPAGHPLREFGQSDRESVQNASDEASVPQALVLMNGDLIGQIFHPWSQVMLAANRAATPDAKIEAVYLTLLSRKPTTVEKEWWSKAQASGLDQMQDLIYALLNTQQFVFVQ